MARQDDTYHIEPNFDYIFTPRDYQEETLDNISSYYRDGVNRLLVFLATGLGKSSGVMMHLPMRFPRLVKKQGFLFLAHRRKILMQAYEKFCRAYPNLWVGLEMGEEKAVGEEDAVFMSVESVGREYQTRIEKYAHRKFGIVVADEGHHVKPEGTWDRILNYFGVGSDPSMHYTFQLDGTERKPLSVFLTATPQRTDDHTLAPFLDAVAGEMDIIEGVREGWLVDVRARRAYDPDDVMEGGDQGEIDFLTKAYHTYLSGKQTLCFAKSVEQSKRFARQLNEHGIAEARHVDATTPKDERRVIHRAFEKGDVEVLSNRLIYTEGVDFPGMQAILDNAPASNQRLHIQKLGRALRPAPDANVDDYETAEERKAAIRASSKPCAWYVATFDPTRYSLDIVAEMTEQTELPDPEGQLLVDEVIDVLETFEEEAPSWDLSSFDTISEVEVELGSANIFTQTVHNERLKALSDYNWIIEEEGRAALWTPHNPLARGSAYKTAPAVYEFEWSDRRGEYIMHIYEGGWNGTAPMSVRKRSSTTGQTDLQPCIRGMDDYLAEELPTEARAAIMRGGNGLASEEQRNYLERKGVPVRVETLDEETARLLKAREKINTKKETYENS